MNKKTLNLAAVCIVIVLLVFLYANNKNKDTAKEFGNISVEGTNTVAGAMITSEDSYQELVLDAVTKQQLAAFEKVSTAYQKKQGDTLSDKISKDVFSQYIQYNSSGLYDAKDIQTITAQNIQNHTIPKASLSEKNLRISQSSLTNLKIYGNNLAAIELALNKAVAAVDNEPNQADYLKALFISTAKLLLKQPVPQSIAEYHLNLINAYADYAHSFILMGLQEKDPAKALLGLQLAKESGEIVVANLEEIRKIIKLNKIAYTEKDMAYYWINSEGNSTIIKTE